MLAIAKNKINNYFCCLTKETDTMISIVNNKLKETFYNIHTKDGITYENIRIVIFRVGGIFRYHVNNGKEYVKDTTLKELIGSMGIMFAKQKINKAFNDVMLNNKMQDINDSIVIYPLADKTPAVCLFRNGKAFKKLKINEIL